MLLDYLESFRGEAAQSAVSLPQGGNVCRSIDGKTVRQLWGLFLRYEGPVLPSATNGNA